MIEREIGPKSLMEGSEGNQELGSSLTMCVCCVVFVPPSNGEPYPPFYRPRGEQGLQMGERGKY